MPNCLVSIAAKVNADRLKLLYHQSVPALFVSFATMLLLDWMLWRPSHKAALLRWTLALVVGTVARLILFISYFRVEPKGQDLLRWERPYALTLFVSSLVWGIGALLLLPAVDLLSQALMLLVLVGMAGGAVSTYSAYRYMAVGAMLAVLLPGTLWLALQPAPEQIGMAVGATIFIVASLRATRVMASALHRNLRLTYELQDARDIADSLAKTDALTGLNNRRAFFERGQQLVSMCERNGHPLCLLLMDIDHFKNINDTLGHHAGDFTLQFVAETLQTIFRRSDVCGRIGGEEFAVLLPNTPLTDARDIAEALRGTIATTAIAIGAKSLSITASIGVSSGVYDLDVLLRQADMAMYRAKADGRNRVMCE